MHYYSARIDAESKMKDTIVLHPDARVVWMEKDEVSFEGRMFDVEKRIRKDGVVLLVGHYDEKDDHLFAALERLFGSEARTGRKNPAQIPFFLTEALLGEPCTFRWFADSKVKALVGQQATVFIPSAPLPVAEAPPEFMRRFFS